MKRTFLALILLGLLSLLTAFLLGWNVGDATQRAAQGRVSLHLLAGLGAVLLNLLIHAIVLTYFMGTNRWLEETTLAYQLPRDAFLESKRLKYRTILAMTFCLFLLIFTGGLGAAADPASAVGFKGWWGIPPATIHMLVALSTVCINLCVNMGEYLAITRNGELVQNILAQVRTIRLARGLEV